MRFNTAVLGIAVSAIIFASISEGACSRRIRNTTNVSANTRTPDAASSSSSSSSSSSESVSQTASTEDDQTEKNNKLVNKVATNKNKGGSNSNNDNSDTSEEAAGSSFDEANSSSSNSSSLSITVEQLNGANPKAASDSYCSSSDDQCSTNADAVDPINNAIAKYGITNRGEIVAVVANMLFESGAWSENINSENTEGGQGTRCMMMWNYVSQYAQELHPDEYEQLMGGSSDNADSASASVRTKVMDLVLDPDDTFGSGFWYLVTVATTYHNSDSKLRDGNVDDFKDYVENGIETGYSKEREQWWTAANKYLLV
ncbi:hypothetical protein GGI15_003465 [Coemansia interrupta]|uniref:Uncharacterized protein n=1 Tax=Coemansia interrupta TaxID=1126814 RepID=A0A9W8LIK4_9FUNG|nr:hypothetical protein GGI15_003465 [Coemansia interrupta]